MYDILSNIIDHAWESGTGYNTTEQQIYFYIAGALIIILTVTFIDLLYRFIRSIFNKGDF